MRTRFAFLSAFITFSQLTFAGAIPSRSTDQDSAGFYQVPAGLADDYPEESATFAKIRQDLETARATGARFLRFAIGWDGVEKAPGQYDWKFWDELVRLAPEYGITLLPYVCYTPRWLNDDEKDFWRRPPRDPESFARFMGVIARRYRGKVASWELWNEPDLENYWLGDVAGFARMIRSAVGAVRQADPGARVVLGGMARGRGRFFDELLKKQGIGVLVDVVNVHGYLETWDQERAEQYPRRLSGMRELMRDYAPKRDLWLAEFGYSDHRHSASKASIWGVDVYYGYEHTPAYQAQALWKHHVLAAASGEVSLMTWYRIHDLPSGEQVIGDDNNRHLGVLDIQGRPKPAFHALKLFNELFDQPYRQVNDEIEVRARRASRSNIHVFEKKDGTWVITAWLRSPEPGEVQERTGVARDSRSEEVVIRLPSRISSLKEIRRRGLSGSSLPPDGVRVHNQELRGIRLRGDEVLVLEIPATT